ncbi:lactonase family protein [Telmatocola sphagniphila]|uniref:Lactonase family protein n=1 Tax=Telmatocola sphagniphila TaxID=1123043 RepID=A0A8E6BB18_9BACT|nr:lactonase family protein [Telmatocola sphagniphila]QVL34754.1 lactonase family protein [Telmatocola sphagniphila]
MSLPRLLFSAVLVCLLTASYTQISWAADAPTWVYFGTYTDNLSKGIYKSELDPATGKLSEPVLVAEATSPSFLAIHPNKKYLYAVSEVSSFNGKKAGAVVSFEIDPKTGMLKELNKASSVGDGPCHLIVDKAGKNVIVANYGGGSCACIPIESDGKLKEATSFHQHAGPVALPKRQGTPHAHSANVSPDGKFVFVADLGLDQIKVYKLDADAGKLTPNDPAFASLAPGAGPRHFAWHPDGKRAYVINEIDMTVTSFDFDVDKGVLTKKQTISTLPKGEMQTPDYKFSTAEVVVHPSGKFLYGSNRTHNTIAMFAIGEDGKLVHLGNQGEGVNIPRNFNIDPSGKWLLVANQEGNTVTVYEIDQKTGKLSGVKQTVKVGHPVCIKFYTP